jgi:putative intracellular protease/amidase
MKVLMVITSHDQLGNTGRKTGFWLEELAAPYYVFKDAGVEITLASPKGGRPPLDPKSNEPEFRTDLTLRFEKDAAARKLSSTTPFASTASSKKTSTPSSTRAAMARCGIWPKTGIPSS